jgi:archaellin
LFLVAVLVAAAIVAILLITSFVLKNESKTIEQVKEQHESELMGIDGVTGVAIGKCESDENNSCIKVYLVNDSADLKKKIPAHLDGFKVETEVTGPITALPK